MDGWNDNDKPGADPGICVRGASPSLFPSPPTVLPLSSLLSPPFPFPSLPFLSPPFPSPPLLFPLILSHSLPSLRLPLEVGPLFAARGSGGALKLPQRVRTEPGRHTVFGEL